MCAPSSVSALCLSVTAVPGEPLDVQATPLNSTSIYVSWKPPQEKDQHGIIRGYHIHLQELKEEVSNGATASTNQQLPPQGLLLPCE